MNVLSQLFMLTLQEQSFDQKEVEVGEIIWASTAKNTLDRSESVTVKDWQTANQDAEGYLL